MKASILLLTYNNLNLTQMCLESILERTPLPDYEVIVVDNASQDGTPAFLEEYAWAHPQVRAILNLTNTGFAHGNNQGAAAARGEYLVFLNNDTVVTGGWLGSLLRHLDDPRVGMVGPVTNSSGNESRIKVDYTDVADMEAFARRYTLAHAGEAFEIEMLPFLCVALRREVFEQVGPLDERFGTGMFEDDDYALRLKEKGYKILCAEDVYIHHWGNASFSKLGQVEYRRLFEENRLKFEQKWDRAWLPHLYRRELLREQVNEMIKAAAWREQEITARDERIARLEQEVATQSAEKINDLQWRLTAAERALHEVQTSTSWRFLEKFRHLLAPPGSRREGTLRRLSAVLQDRPTGPMISWEAYYFQRFKQRRYATTTPRLDGLQMPCVPGLVSIVLPVYNGEDYVRESLDSILAQTYQDFELIAVDDGSQDATPRILDDYARHDQRIQVIHQANQRLPSALNAGFRRTRGEFLTWTSSDNHMKPDFLARMADCLSRHPEWDAIFANIDIIGDDGQPLRNSDWYSGSQDPPGSEHIRMPADTSTLNIIANNTVGSAFMYRQRVDTLLGDYSPRRFGTEDYDYWMRVNALLTLKHVDFDEPVYEYRLHSTSLTARDKELGITRGREALMVFEDARRDFYNSPLAWLVSSDGSPAAQALAGQVREQALRAGHLVLEGDNLDWGRSHRLWFPLAAIMVTGDPSRAAPPTDWPEQACPILVAAGEAPLPEAVDPAWALCLSPGDRSDLPRLNKPRQGWLGADDLAALLAAIDIRVKSLHLEMLEAEIAAPPNPKLKISAVICTYRRGPQLGEAIRSVIEQSFPKDDFEILVVNNEPADAVVEQIVAGLRAELAGREQRLRLIECPFKGLSHARNAGISAARGELACFLDDDAAASPDWLEQTWRAYRENPQAGVLGGTILLDPPAPRPRWAKPDWDHYWSAFTPDRSETYTAATWWDYPWGANWSATRQALLEMGGFRARYGRRGADFSGGEEIIAASLAERLGYRVIIVPAAKVYHRPHPGRYSLRHIASTLKGQWLSGYLQQIDLYTPDKLDLPTVKIDRRKYLRRAFLPSRQPLYRRLESYYLARALSAVIRLNRADLRARQRLYKEQNSVPAPQRPSQDRQAKEGEKQRRQIMDLELKAILSAHAAAKGVVVFAPTITWQTKLFQRPQHLALAFARQGYLTFMLEPPWSTLYAGELHPVDERMYVAGVGPWDIFHQLKSPIVFTLAYNRAFLEHFNSPRVVYEYIDELNVFPYDLATMERDHEALLRSAQVVAATAERLYRRLLPVRPDAILSPNAVDEEFIRGAIAAAAAPPEELASIVGQGRPIIGYYGALAEWFDYSLLAQAARERPDYAFVLIGPDYDGSLARSGVREQANITWVDWKPYDELPAYLKYFDVATIPFQLGDLTHATSPLKLFEYAAARKPIVTTALQECRKYEQVLVAHDASEYAVCLDEALKLRGDETYLQSLDQLARQNTWTLRVEAILKALGVNGEK